MRRWSLLNLLTLLLSLPAGADAPRADVPGPDVLKVGVSVSDLGNRYFQRIGRAIDREARLQAGDAVRVEVVSSAYDVARQIGQVDRFIVQGVDLILLSAATYDGVTPAILRAKQAGIPVIGFDVQAAGLDAAVTTDNRQAGRIACDDLARRLNGQGQVVILNGPPVSSILARVEGCLEELNKHPALQLLSTTENGGGSVEGGFEKMTHLLTAYPDLDGVFTINDPTALGAERAARLAGRSSFIITSVDGSPAATARIAEPDSLLVSTASQLPDLVARLAVRLGLRLLDGEALEKKTWLIAPELIDATSLQSQDQN
ncbi:substrate-binding domain-containing protein [Marinobacterium sp. YM272]|uniref:substrate-binding domain-containing protein n=1 Tax=Marinobacterium sp. YM272 TaxID=3421654 RepID=UPI003D7F1B9F